MTLPDEGDNITSLLLAQRVELLYGDASDSSADKNLTMMRGLSVSQDHPRRRINHGMERFYVHPVPDITMSFTVSGDINLYDFLRVRSVRNAGGIIPRYWWAFKATDTAASSASSKTVQIQGQLDSVTFTKPMESQDDPFDISCEIIAHSEKLSL